MNIKSINEAERPREKAIKLGIEALSDYELLAIIIGFGGENNSALDISYELLKSSKGLTNFFNYTYEELIKIKGIKKVKAISILAIGEIISRIEHLKFTNKAHIISSRDIYKMYRLRYIKKEREEILLILLNNTNQIVKEEVIALGSINSVNINMRDIFHTVLKNNVNKYILIHNHPGGSSEPSNEDIMYTKILNEKSKEIGLKLLDHIIIGNVNYFSFKDNTLI